MDGEFSPAMLEMFGEISAFMGVDLLGSVTYREVPFGDPDIEMVRSTLPPTQRNIERAARATKMERALGMGAVKRVVIEDDVLLVPRAVMTERNMECAKIRNIEMLVLRSVRRHNKSVASFDDMRRQWILGGSAGRALDALVRRAANHRKGVNSVGVGALAKECLGVLRFGRHEYLCQELSRRAVGPVCDPGRWPRAQEYLAGQTPILALEVVAHCVLAESLRPCDDAEIEAVARRVDAEALVSTQSFFGVVVEQLVAIERPVRQLPM